VIAIGKTSTEVKNRWNRENYKRYTISLRKSEDKELIDFVESHKESVGITDIFRAGVDAIKKSENNA
jgi:hypothetical protein